jgi:predicted permease
LRRLLAKLRNFFNRRRAEDEMIREIAAHLALLEDEFLRRGMDLPEARLAARRAYGGVEQAKELHRDARSLFWLEQMLQDVRHAWRSLRKSPGFVTVALLSLAFGIGVNTSIFTLVNGILLKKLPVPDPDRIVQLRAHVAQFDSSGFSYPVFRELRKHGEIFTDAVAFSGRVGALDTGAEPRKVEYAVASGNYFAFFGARPAIGRLLDDEDDRVEGAHRVCVLSYAAWQSLFGGDFNILNRTIRIDGNPLQVIGVAKPDFVGAELQQRYDLWVPTALAKDLTQNKRDSPNVIWLSILARLKPGISFAEARARLTSASRSIEDALPKNRANAGAVYQFQDASKGFDTWRTELHDPLLILMGAVTLVLLVACANLANLLLARTSERHQEFAIKLSLGISRRRLLGQLLIETLLVAFSGGALAFALSLGLTRLLLLLFNAGNRYIGLDVLPDGSVLVYAFVACLLTGLIAGLYPAWQASRTGAASGLKGSASLGMRRTLVRRSLILVQVALAVVLLFGASLFTHSLRQLYVTNLGYALDHVVAIDIQERSVASFLNGTSRAQPVFRDLLARVRQLPGVESAAVSEIGVLSGNSMWDDVTVHENPHKISDVSIMIVCPGYLATMRIPLLRGRDFATYDRKGAPPVAVINQRLASLIAAGHDGLGVHLDTWDVNNLEVVGVAGNTRNRNAREATKPLVYLAFDQVPVYGGVLELRSSGAPAQWQRSISEMLKTIAPEFKVANVTALELMRDNTLAQDRFLTFLSTLFGVLGTALALVGIYGLISYSVTRRTREVGIRMSIGAQRRDVLSLFLREAAFLVAGGMLIGLPLAMLLARFLRKMLFEVSTSDPLGISVTLALLALGGLLASFVPARRATRVNPVQALRYD